MSTRVARCHCGQLTVACVGEPVRVSVCHCLNCQRRSGSSFAAQARWPAAAISIAGDVRTWIKPGDDGDASFHFCPDCGSTVCYVTSSLPELIAVAIGAFADPLFPAPAYSVFEGRKHAWVQIVDDDIEHHD